MHNPIIAEVTRGNVVESQHRGFFTVVDETGKVLTSAGDPTVTFFPRSAIKAFQCLPLIETGAADRFGLNDEEIALCCSSHNGEPEHVRVARSILAKAGIDEACYECGAQMPYAKEASYQLIREGNNPLQVHNCCSGKHAGMLVLAKHLGASLTNYIDAEHPVQQAVAECLSRYTGENVKTAARGIDGCSVPTWALPLRSVALAFARLGRGDAHCQRIISAVRAHPEMVEGKGGFDTRIMNAVPRLFIKYGAEGSFCGCIPHAGLGFTVKSDDGARRAVEVAIAQVLGGLECWTPEEQNALQEFTVTHLRNWRKLDVGDVRAAVS
ncbi:asparaginase [Aestuariivirga litoralis]|uniref:asparaginase n=1 Tax=Aestuariivirga litoralis TaxID=2650924 RepID=UPI0018C72F82|nr:asparaginase [Aestuariivirga litoralis]MBG1232488.1 asparaginase [Aestuariivirga litoralis]